MKMSRWAIASLLVLAMNIPSANAQGLDSAKLKESLSRASKYKNVEQFWKKLRKSQTVRIVNNGALAWATFISSYDAVTAAAITWGYPLRPMTEKEFETITPNKDLLIVNVKVGPKVGLINTNPFGYRLRYLDGKAHLILKIGDSTYEPVAMAPVTTDQVNQASVTSLESSSVYWGRWLGWTTSTYAVSHMPLYFVIGFSFDIPAQDRNKTAQVILIDGDGNKGQHAFDLSGVWE
jgi:hypothetical protein